jgi:lactoylglutathione lyase
MLCVGDLDAAKRFYVDGLGMTLFDRMDVNIAPRCSAIFVGFDAAEGMLELTQYHDGDGPYARRPGFGHVALGVPDLDSVMDKLEAMGVEVVKPRHQLVPTAPPAAFVKDFDGYEVELIQTLND